MPRGIYKRTPLNKPTGRPPAHVPVGAICEWCKEAFFRKPYIGNRLRFCGKDCRNLAIPSKGRPRKLPSVEVVIDHYTREGLTLWEIAKKYGLRTHKPVEAMLERAGVPRRRAWTRPRLTCAKDNCDNPPLKIKHSNNGSFYGTLCAEHREIHMRKLNRAIGQRNRQIPVEKQEPWRWIENKPEEVIWIGKARKMLKEARALLSQQRGLEV